MRTGIVWVFLLASLSLLTARGAAHRADLIEHWRREATPVTRDVISNALALAETTVTVVTEAGANVSALSAELSAVQRDWAAEGIPTNEYESFYFSVRSLRREILFNHPSLNFEKILINRNPPTTYSHNGDQHLGMQPARSGFDDPDRLEDRTGCDEYPDQQTSVWRHTQSESIV